MRLSSHSSEPDAPDSAQASWRVRDLMSLMESWYPQATAQPWDRVGLIVGDPDAPVRSLLLAPDPTAARPGGAPPGLLCPPLIRVCAVDARSPGSAQVFSVSECAACAGWGTCTPLNILDILNLYRV